MKKNNLRKMVCTALFCALAYICVFLFRFSGIGGFLTFDAKDAVMTLCALFFGPVAGLSSVVLVTVLEAITISGTGIYGLVMNFLSSAAFVLAASLIYKYRRNIRGAIFALTSSVFLMTAVMLLANLFITPYYIHSNMAAVAGMIPTVLLPFNLTKAVFNAALVLLLYKPLSGAMKKAGVLPSSGEGTYHMTGRSVAVLTVSLVLIAGCICVLLFVLNGHFELFRS